MKPRQSGVYDVAIGGRDVSIFQINGNENRTIHGIAR